MCRPLQWVWGLIPVAVLAAMAYSFAVPKIEQEISDNATKALDDAGHGWARLSVDGRDIALHGTAPTAQALDEAVSAAASAEGVGKVSHDVIVRVAPVN